MGCNWPVRTRIWCSSVSETCSTVSLSMSSPGHVSPAARGLGLAKLNAPLLMGELMVFARRV